MPAFYNEIDPFAAAWLRELIAAGHIAPGVVDERSIEDIVPSELVGYTQCHFFAGIGVWSYVLRQAGWPDDRPIWTGSCPCQPFSAAGKGGGVDDERHLWPAFFWLIRQCRPDIVIGEQVESAIKHDWLDHVALSLEGIGYAVGAVGFPACGTGAPHIRQRLYWVAESGCMGLPRFKRRRYECKSENGLPARRVADAERLTGEPGRTAIEPGSGPETQGAGPYVESGRCGNAGVLGDSESENGGLLLQPRRSRQAGAELRGPGPTNGFWSDAEWLPCRDGKARPVEPGTFPLAHGAPARVGRLRGYGNAIVAPAAEAFIKAVMTHRG